MALQVPNSIVSVDWLHTHIENNELIIFDATIPKVTGAKIVDNSKKQQIKGAVFFDIKNEFSDTASELPNTVLTPKDFEEKAQKIGVNNNSCIVVYDDFGLYSAPRVWWMFQLMGFTNIAVLDGGLPKWKSKNYPLEHPEKHQTKKGNFRVNYQAKKVVFAKDVLENIHSKKNLVVDARSKGRFYATEPEPRKGLAGGHIPNSKSLSHAKISEQNQLKSKEELVSIYKEINPKNQPFIFSCGSGITASVLALGADVAGYTNYAVYDGSWTEWASTPNLPIEK